MKYQRIEPFPTKPSSAGQLRGLGRVWAAKRNEIGGTPGYALFLERLKREWAIETGIIERIYVWDRGVTEILIEQGIHAAIIEGATQWSRDRVEQVRAIVLDQQEVVEALFDFVANRRELTESYVKELHAALTRNQSKVRLRDSLGQWVERDLLRGAYKQVPNNPSRSDGTTHEYCPPELVTDEMEALIAGWRAIPEGAPIEAAAAWLHHRFTQIHPFEDGNGRVARALASLVFIKSGLLPLVVRNHDRAVYIEALERADGGDLSPLVTLFGKRQEGALLTAIQLESATSRNIDEVIGAAQRDLRQGLDAVRPHPLAPVMDVLSGESRTRLSDLAQKLSPALKALSADFKASPSVLAKGAFFNRQLGRLAKEFGYDPDFEHGEVAAIKIVAFKKAYVVIGLHAHASSPTVGSVVAGLIVPGGPVGAASEPFNFTAEDDPAETLVRFRPWLEQGMVVALETWRRSLSA